MLLERRSWLSGERGLGLIPVRLPATALALPEDVRSVPRGQSPGSPRNLRAKGLERHLCRGAWRRACWS